MEAEEEEELMSWRVVADEEAAASRSHRARVLIGDTDRGPDSKQNIHSVWAEGIIRHRNRSVSKKSLPLILF